MFSLMLKNKDHNLILQFMVVSCLSDDGYIRIMSLISRIYYYLFIYGLMWYGHKYGCIPAEEAKSYLILTDSLNKPLK